MNCASSTARDWCIAVGRLAAVADGDATLARQQICLAVAEVVGEVGGDTAHPMGRGGRVLWMSGEWCASDVDEELPSYLLNRVRTRTGREPTRAFLTRLFFYPYLAARVPARNGGATNGELAKRDRAVQSHRRHGLTPSLSAVAKRVALPAGGSRRPGACRRAKRV